MSRWLTTGDGRAGPVSAGRSGSSRNPSTGSASSYPVIPRRTSSLSRTDRHDSGVPATSTRTPSLSDSLYQIEVMKRRHPGTQMQGHDPFQDNMTPGRNAMMQSHHANNGYQLGPQLVFRWSSGSWDPSGPAGQSGSPLPNRRAPVERLQPSLIEATNDTLDFLDSTAGPVTFLNVRTSADGPYIGGGPGSLWTSLYISADVSSTPPPNASRTGSLDLVILLDNLHQPSDNLLTQVNMCCSVLVSHLTYMRDRIALVHLDQMSHGGLRVLQPLAFHHMNTIQSALNIFSQNQFDDDRTIASDIGSAMERVCQIFTSSPRQAYFHLFFISASPPDHLSVPSIHPAIEFHTITPLAYLPLSIATPQAGWHISYTVGDYDTGPRETLFIRKIAKVIRHLRTGIRPGSAVNLTSFILPEGGCQIQSVLDDHFLQVNSLRPGETWSIRVQVRVPPAFEQLPQSEQTATSPQNPMITQMMSQIHTVMEDYLPEQVAQALVTLRAQYRHSLLPSTHTVTLENTLTVTRQMQSNSGGQPSGEFSLPGLSEGSLSDSF